MKYLKFLKLGISILFTFSFIFFSCKKDNLISSSQVNFTVSTDTLLFDTIFTDVGSITKRIIVRNHEHEKIKLNKVYVNHNLNQTFKINVNGILKPIVEGVEIYPKDSIFIFIEATVNPNKDTNPFIIDDELIFIANDTEKKVHLSVWGQNAHYYNSDIDSLNYIVFDTDKTLDNDLPHIFYSNIVVENNATLTINEGARIHLANQVNIIVHQGGKLHINGSGYDENRVQIQGSRLDDDYLHKPGQWGVIRICQDAGDSWIKNTDIRNGTIGCYLGGPVGNEPFDVTLTPKLNIENSIITNMSHYGLLLQASNSKIENSEISDCGEMAIFNYIGGKCHILHSTIANYYSGRNTVSMVLTNHVTDHINNTYFNKPLLFKMENSILYGSYNTELVLNQTNEAGFDIHFNSCLIRAEPDKDLNLSDNDLFTDCIFNEDPLFIRKYENQYSDYQLNTLSAAQNIANPTFSGLVPTDLSGKSRLQDGQPDVGAYERED